MSELEVLPGSSDDTRIVKIYSTEYELPKETAVFVELLYVLGLELRYIANKITEIDDTLAKRYEKKDIKFGFPEDIS